MVIFQPLSVVTLGYGLFLVYGVLDGMSSVVSGHFHL